MSSKLLVVVVSDDVKASVGVRMASRMIDRRNLEDVRVLFFGPSERLLADPPADLVEPLRTVGARAPVLACRFVAEEFGVSQRLLDVGAELVPAGQEIEQRLLDGYQVMTF